MHRRLKMIFQGNVDHRPLHQTVDVTTAVNAWVAIPSCATAPLDSKVLDVNTVSHSDSLPATQQSRTSKKSTIISNLKNKSCVCNFCFADF